MTKLNNYFVFLLFSSLAVVYSPMIQADMQQQSYGNQISNNRAYSPVTSPGDPLTQLSYGQKIGNKALNGFANVLTSPLELPKNIINTYNQTNFYYGVVGGFLKGLVNLLGRTGCGIADLITFPLPTKPIVYPVYIWDNFDADTSYGEAFRLDKTQKTDQSVTQIPGHTTGETAPETAVVDHSSQ